MEDPIFVTCWIYLEITLNTKKSLDLSVRTNISAITVVIELVKIQTI